MEPGGVDPLGMPERSYLHREQEAERLDSGPRMHGPGYTRRTAAGADGCPRRCGRPPDDPAMRVPGPRRPIAP